MARRSAARPRSRSTSTSRSASRSARTATSSSSPGRRRAARATGSGSSSTRVLREIDLRADALDAALPAARPPLRDGLPRRRDAVAAAGRRRSSGCSRACASGSGSPPDAEITLEANPGPDERGDPAALRRGRRHADLVRGAVASTTTELRRLGRRHRAAHVADAVAEARDGRASASINVDLLYDIPERTCRPGWRRSTPRSPSSPTTCRCTP